MPVPPAYSAAAQRWLLIVVWLAFVAEALLFTFGRNALGPYWSPVLLSVCGLLMAGAGAAVAAGRQLSWPTSGQQMGWTKAFALGAVVLSILLTGGVVAKQIALYPVTDLLPHSDIVPALQVYTSRFLTGQSVYTEITLAGYRFLPNYPPFQWLPFVPAELLGIDYRWFAMGAWWAGLALYQWQLARLRLRWPEWLLKAVLPLLVLHFMVLTERQVVAFTVESLIFGYYALLAVALLQRSVALRASALVLCVLSRYSLALWLPLYALLLWHENPRQAWRTVLLAVVLAVVIFVPFLWHDPTIFFRAQLENYNITLDEWQNHIEDTLHGWPRHVFTGVGLAPWWYRGAEAAPNSISQLQIVHFTVCAAVPLLFGLWWWPRRERLDSRIVAVLSLKAYLVVFYAFLIVPYVYLAVLSLVWSWFVVLALSVPKANHARSSMAESIG